SYTWRGSPTGAVAATSFSPNFASLPGCRSVFTIEDTTRLFHHPKEPLPMPTLIAQPTRITAAGNKPKLIDEYVGRVNSRHHALSIAHMRSPQGWVEPGQTPEFDEFTVVLKGLLRVRHREGVIDVH